MRSSHSWIVSAVLFSVPHSASGGEIWVSSSGDDSQQGTEESPFKSIPRAQEEVKKLEEDGTIVVHVQGVHRLEEPLRFGAEDGGDEKRSVTYRGGDGCIVSGGRVLSGWERRADGVWTVSCERVLKEAAGNRQLIWGEQRLHRARFPNEGEFLRVRRVSEDVREMEFDRDLPAGTGQDVELVMLQNWSISRVKILSLDGRQVKTKNPVGWIGHGPATTASPGKPAYLEGDPAFLDASGEWCVDWEEGQLLLVAPEGIDPTDAVLTVPVTDQLLVLEGSSEQPVRNLHFEGIDFQHAGWKLPEEGYLGIQAGHHGTEMKGPIFVLPGAIEWIHAVDCSLSGCALTHTGASGVCLGAGCLDNRIARCRLRDIGGNGIMIGWRGKGNGNPFVGDQSLSADWGEEENVPKRNEVCHNLLERCASVNHGCVGIYDGFSEGSRIAHNCVRKMPYTGISVGFRWNTSETSQKNCSVEWNHIHDCMTLLADGGGIYTLGYQPGTVLRGNYIHDIHRSRVAHGGAPNNGIFFDQGSKGYLVEKNVIHDADGGAIRFNQTSKENMTWKENSFGASPGEPGFPEELAEKAGPDWGDR